MFVRIDPRRPLGQQVYIYLSRAIREGDLPPGTRLPSSRRLAEGLSLSRNTILYAYERLLAEGYIEARRAAGTFVSSSIPVQSIETSHGRRRRPGKGTGAVTPRLSAYGRRVVEHALTHPQLGLGGPRRLRCDFARGYTLADRTSLLAWNQILRRKANEIEASPEATLERATASPLQKALADHLHRTRGVNASPEQVIIVTGSQQAFQLTAQLLLDPGDKVVIEDPHYVGARNSFLSSGARLIPVPVDKAGLEVESIPRRASGAKLAYVVPSQQWPTGVVMPLARRLELLRWARENEAVVIEDDCNCEYQHAGPPIESLQGIDDGGRVIYGGTLTRLFLPLHPVGYLVVPEALLESYLALDVLACFRPSAFEQDLLAEFISAGHLERLTRRARRRNTPVLRSLRETLRRYLASEAEVFPARAGFHIYARLRSVVPAQADELIRRAARVGVGLCVDLPLYLRAPETVGLIFSIADLTEVEVAEGVRKLARILNTWPTKRRPGHDR